jgi:signal peptidase II
VSKLKDVSQVTFRDLTLWGLVPLVVSWGIDLATQSATGSLQEPWFLGLVGLMPTRETSFLLGSVTDLPSSLINTAAVAVACLLAFVYVALQWSMTTRSMMIRLGLSCFLGGVLGHASQRLLHGTIVSFIAFGTEHLHTPTFNFGDLFQMFGVALAVAGSWRETGNIWPYRNVRASFSYWVNPVFQLRHCMLWVGCCAVFGAVLCGFGYAFLRGALVASGVPIEGVDRFSSAFLITSVLLILSFLGAMFFVGLVQSHRIVGPIYAFERFVEDLFLGKARKLKLRTGDQFRQLETLAEELENRLKDASDKKTA